MKPSFPNQKVGPVEGSYVVTFRDGDDGAGIRLLRKKAGIRDFVHANDYHDRAIRFDQFAEGQGAVFDDLNMCIVGCPKTAIAQIESDIPDSSILAIEPDHQVFAIGSEAQLPVESPHLDTGNAAWGVSATGVEHAKYSGIGIRIAVLDTGLDSRHPDFASVNVLEQQSFLSNGETIDSNGHGTHCTGILAGPHQPHNAPTYGVACDADIYVAQVLNRDGGGNVRQILAGLNWAIGHKCDVVSMSVGADLPVPATMFEEAGKRALDAGTLVVAAAGNNADRTSNEFGFVVRPANSRFIMAVGAVDRDLQPAGFSSRSSVVAGGAVDIVAPGVEVFSSWPGTETYRSLSGTSMATPFVAGIAALHAEASGARGRELWRTLLESAVSLPLPTVDAGAGLVRSP